MNLLPAVQVKSLLIIASQLSGYPIPDIPPPKVEALTTAEMAKEACGDDMTTQLFGCRIVGFFDGETGRVAIDAEKGNGVSAEQSVNTITVHELTHWLQFHNNAWPKQCPARFMIEYEAYKAGLTYQIKYEHLDPPDYFYIPPTACPVDIK